MELKITGLSKTYPGGVQALKNLSLTISNGMFGLLGPNGAGKSTLMRIIATLQEPDTGSVTLNGLDVLKEKREVKKILGYLPQEFGLYPKVKAEELLGHIAALKGITNKKQRKETVESLLLQTNLYDVRKMPLGSFSGGMKQRFGIAQALLGDPKLIIVDEPTAGLDPEERLRFHNLLTEIGENIVVILSTHIVEDVSDLCNNMAIIDEGKLVLVNKPQKAIDHLKGNVWAKLIEKEELQRHKDEYKIISTRLFAGKVNIHVYDKEKPAKDFTETEPDLKDVYFFTIKMNAFDYSGV